jgi:hypothetical protein
MVDLPQPTLLDYILCLCIFFLTALPYLNSLEGNMVCCSAHAGPPAFCISRQPGLTRHYNTIAPTRPHPFSPLPLPALPVL